METASVQKVMDMLTSQGVEIMEKKEEPKAIPAAPTAPTPAPSVSSPKPRKSASNGPCRFCGKEKGTSFGGVKRHEDQCILNPKRVFAPSTTCPKCRLKVGNQSFTPHVQHCSSSMEASIRTALARMRQDFAQTLSDYVPGSNFVYRGLVKTPQYVIDRTHKLLVERGMPADWKISDTFDLDTRTRSSVTEKQVAIAPSKSVVSVQSVNSDVATIILAMAEHTPLENLGSKDFADWVRLTQELWG